MAFAIALKTDGWEVVVEDDDRVCYAYLLKDGDVCSDVWLYNRVAAPAEPEWKLPDARTRMPFLNPIGYISEQAAAGEEWDWELLRADWEAIEDGEVRLLYADQTSAVLRAGTKPGRSLRATKDGPLARCLNE